MVLAVHYQLTKATPLKLWLHVTIFAFLATRCSFSLHIQILVKKESKGTVNSLQKSTNMISVRRVISVMF